MRALLAICLLGTLASCHGEIADAERERDMVRSVKPEDPAAVCDAERKVADAYLKAHDQKGYEVAKVTADIYCRRADQIRRGY